jgi:hypothetical protein
MLTKRQETAAAITGELARIGGYVVSPLPLRDSEQLRFQVASHHRDSVLAKLGEWGWNVRPAGESERLLPQGGGAAPMSVSVYVIELPKEKPTVPPLARPMGEIASVAEKEIRRKYGLGARR